jgi:hypothetical protein
MKVNTEGLKPLPQDLWGVHEEKVKKGTTGETAWYTQILEDVSTAAWWLTKQPTQERLTALLKAIEKWDDVLGWDGTLRTGITDG